MTVFDSAQQIITDHPAVDAEHNPVIARKNNLGFDALVEIIANYARFPREIVSVLSSAQSALIEWSETAGELERNISEEMGDGSAEKAHYPMFRDGVFQEFGVDVEDYEQSLGTQRFLSSIRGLVSHAEPTFAAGAVYTIEATAVPELLVVKALTTELALFMNKSGINPDGLLFKFLESHISDFEIEHEQGLRKSLAGHLQVPEGPGAFLEGCEEVMNAMDEWWASLARTS